MGGLVVTGKHHILLDDLSLLDGLNLANQRRRLWMQHVNTPPLVTIVTTANPTDLGSSSDTDPNNSNKVMELPHNINLLTLEPLGDGAFLLRLEHVFEAHESQSLSQPVSIDLEAFVQSLLPGSNDCRVAWIRETTLGGNMWKGDFHRLGFWAESNDISDWTQRWMTQTSSNQSAAVFNSRQLELKPMEIRTFIFQIESTSFNTKVQ